MEGYLESVFEKVCKIHTRLPHGGILVFLTGREEIETLCRWVRQKFPAKTQSNNASTNHQDPRAHVAHPPRNETKTAHTHHPTPADAKASDDTTQNGNADAGGSAGEGEEGSSECTLSTDCTANTSTKTSADLPASTTSAASAASVRKDRSEMTAEEKKADDAYYDLSDDDDDDDDDKKEEGVKGEPRAGGDCDDKNNGAIDKGGKAKENGSEGSGNGDGNGNSKWCMNAVTIIEIRMRTLFKIQP